MLAWAEEKSEVSLKFILLYYSAIKRNKIESFVETWMDLETVTQSEVSQKEKNTYRILTQIGRASCRERV